ncbi:MAG TPA: hypothetical protein VGX75_12700 [bacterium]|nr:hypothetical protein [bacterium]
MAGLHDDRLPMAIIPAHSAFRILRFAYAVVPVVMGLDKFVNALAAWPHYLAPVISESLPVSPAAFMRAAGVVEIAAGLIVAFYPIIGGWLVAAWLWATIADLLLGPGYYDIAMRDFGLSLGAAALARLAAAFALPAQHGAFRTDERRPAA